CAVDWIDRDVKLRRTGIPRAELFAFENARRFILDSFTDHDFAADVYEIEHAAHRVASSRIGCFLIATTEPTKGIERRGFGRAHKIDLNDALDVLIILFRQSQSHEAQFSRRSRAMTRDQKQRDPSRALT